MEVRHVPLCMQWRVGAGDREVTESVGGAVTGNAANSPPLVAESSESNADAFKEAYTVDESKWEMPADLKAKYA